jgi:hypothetical protein
MKMIETTEAPSHLTEPYHAPLDVIGASASFLCALHCALLPIVLTVLPLGKLGWLGGHTFDLLFVGAALSYGVVVIGSAYQVHLNSRVWLWYVASAVFFLLGLTFFHDGIGHAVLMSTGGLSLGIAHLANQRAIHRHSQKDCVCGAHQSPESLDVRVAAES